ncbi:RAD55 family ATPase [Halopenitus sp. H-Gu1]|uniref:RAD55 family ATPase n=1 Tax=Halopenitus sp. H-Gu1 TaxID=3242697 RepID=UPI00359CDFD2
MDESITTYEVDTDFPIPELSSVEAGQNLLFVGPDDVDCRSLGLQFLAGGTSYDQGSLVITFDGSVESIIEQYQTFAEEDDLDSLAVIDCSDSEEPPDSLTDSQYFPVQSPSSLTDIGISFIEYDDTRAENFVGTRVLVESITALLEHVPEERAFEFINAFVGRFATAGYLGVWTMDSSAHDEQTRSTFEELFDGIVEFRQADGTAEYRVRGLQDETSEWASFSDA